MMWLAVARLLLTATFVIVYAARQVWREVKHGI